MRLRISVLLLFIFVLLLLDDAQGAIAKGEKKKRTGVRRRSTKTTTLDDALTPTVETARVLEEPTAVVKPGASSGRRPPRFKQFCSGSSNSRSIPGLNALQNLRKIYTNCTRVFGNLEITHVRLNGSDSNGKSSANDFLDMFADIEEVKGYILIYRNEGVRRISFPRLRIVWGDELHDSEYAIQILSNRGLQEISMPQLRAVHEGRVQIFDNPTLGFVQSRVRYEEISVNAEWNVTNNAEPSATEKCHPSCHANHCWTEKEGDCQAITRFGCNDCGDAGQCYWKNGTAQCCHNTCAAGCFGPTNQDCYACAQKVQDGVCVESCSPLKIYNRTTKRMEPNEEGYYAYDRYCYKKCPDQTLIQDSNCVGDCEEGYYHDVNWSTRQCKPCPPEGCPKVCKLSEQLTMKTLPELENCVAITGFIDLQTASMRESYTDPTTGVRYPPIEADKLMVLSKVKSITGFVHIAMQEMSPAAFDFLSSLEVIEGRELASGRHALVISSNDNLEELHLNRLRKILNGDVVISRNNYLCLASSVDWTRLFTPGNNQTAKVVENRKPKKCESERRSSCSSTCLPSAGCWGLEAEHCVGCMHQRIRFNHTCVDQCPVDITYRADDFCEACHPECNGCSGPDDDDCLQCRHFSLVRPNSTSVCVAECPSTHYVSDTTCTPCHAACYDHGCTGPAPNLGPGGCNRCRFAKLSDDDTRPGTIEHCLVGTSQSTVCTENHLDSYFSRIATGNETERVENSICVSCSRECLTCTGLGVETHDNSVRCQCRNYTLLEVSGKFPETCTLSCDGPDRYLIEHQNDSTSLSQQCERCDETCDGCHGPSEIDCTQCRIAEILQPDGTKKCATKCPPDEPFGPYEDKRCSKEDRDAIRSRRAKLALSLSIFALIVIAVLIGAIIYRCNRYRKDLETERHLNEPVLPPLKPVDPNAKPNMNRLILIPAEQLAHKASCLLGSGAFGAVYAGIWMPEGRDGPRAPVAIKIVKDLSPQTQQDILDEAFKMAMLQHRHLLRLVGVCLAGDRIQVVTQLRPLGDLLNFLRKHRQSLAGRDLLIYCYQIALAMEYLFERRLVHRDLAARNVLVKSVNHVEVTDFGLAKLLDYNEESAHVVGRVAPKWLALECFSTKSYNHQTDVWAFGVTCWEILTYGTTPYSQLRNDDLESWLEAGHRLEQPNNCSLQVYYTLFQCWVADPQSRPNFVLLREQFEKYCSAPHLFVTDKHSTMRMESYSSDVQRGLVMDLLDEQQSEIVDLNYFDDSESSLGRQPHPAGGHHTLSSQRTVCTTLPPPTPASPGSQKPLLARTRTSPLASSSSAGRFNFEMTDLTPPRPVEVGLDGEQYLLPTTRVRGAAAAAAARYYNDSENTLPEEEEEEEGQEKTVNAEVQLYTPVVLENGDTELVSSHDYYNVAEASSPKRTKQKPAITRQDTMQAQDAESTV